MARTDISTVKEIITTGLSDSIITTHIGIANRMVTNNLGTAGLDSDVLTDIETYLTAHLIAIGKERQAITEKVGDVSVTYQGKFGEALKMTTYGQMVLTLDETGIMENLGKGAMKIRAIRQIEDND